MNIKGVCSCCMVLCMCVFSNAYSADFFDLSLKIDFNDIDDGYQYRQENELRIKSLLLFGNVEQRQVVNNNKSMFEVKKNLESFLNHHLETAKKGLETVAVASNVEWYTGDTSFLSKRINKGQDIKPAKLAGFSIDFGKIKFGGGYSWGEKNPAFLRSFKKGMVLGASYGIDDWQFQTSVVSSGSNPYNFASDIGNTSVMMGATWMQSEKRGYTATAQYQNDEGAVLFTFGTKYKF